MGDPILRLDAIVPERAFIEIKSNLYPEGKRYELRQRPELSPYQLQTIVTRATQASEIEEKKAPSPAEMVQLQEMQDEILKIAMYTPLEDEVFRGLDLFQKSEIIMAFNLTCFGADTPPPETKQVKKTRPKRKTATGG